jgi:multiple sugar transport system permease protein
LNEKLSVRSLKTSLPRYFAHGVLFSVINLILAIAGVVLLATLVIVGAIIGLIIGILILFLAEGAINSFLTRRIWNIPIKTHWTNLLAHGCVLFIGLFIVSIPSFIVNIYVPNWPVTAVLSLFYCFIDGYLAKIIAMKWKEEVHETRTAPKITKFTIASHIASWVIATIWIIPFLGVFLASIRPFSEVQFGWWNIHPFTIDLHNFIDALTGQTSGAPLSNAMLNSLIVAVPATFIPIFVAALAAYSFARFRSRTKDLLFLVIVLLQTIPQQAVIIPVFTLFSNWHLLSNYVALILLHTAFGLPWQILFLRNFFATLPIEIEEAARVDGASYFKIFYKIVLPLTLPALASLVSLQFVFVWNDFFFALTTITDPTKRLATQVVPLLVGRYELNWSLLAAGSMLVMVLPVAVYIALQRYYVKGLTAGAVKG